MRAEPLYRITFVYRETFRAGDDVLLLAEGTCEGRVAGRFRGANRARLASTGAWIPQLEGAVVTEDGATILLQLSGRGLPDADPVGRVTAAVTHTTVDERYAWQRHGGRRRRRGLPRRAGRPRRRRAALGAAA